MKLSIHATVFSVVFAGFMASAFTIKPTNHAVETHSLVISAAMPVPNCPPDTGCPLASE